MGCMNKIVAISTLAWWVAISVDAQTLYDAAKFTTRDLNGTARFIGMGGAMGALGGDISVMKTNPAGIGIYRSNDAALSFGTFSHQTESTYLNRTFNDKRNRFSFDNLGVVLSIDAEDKTLRYVNFGVNYTHSKSFYKNISMEGMMGTFKGHRLSQVNQMARQATDAAQYVWQEYGEHLKFGSDAIYSDNDAGWLGAMGYQGELLQKSKNTEGYHTYTPIIPNAPYSTFHSKESGGIDQFDCNVSFNLSDRIYFGITAGMHVVDYTTQTSYGESYGREEGYVLNSYNKTGGFEYEEEDEEEGARGAGYDVKLGIIVRPFAHFPLRIGFAVHSPVFYRLTYTTHATMQSSYRGANNQTHTVGIDTQRALDGDMDMEYKLRTPWKYNFNLGFTIGKSFALGAEYEYEDYSTMKFRDIDGHNMSFETNEARINMKGVNTFRIGTEIRPLSQLAVRLGYNYISAAFKEDAVKYLPSNSLYTDTSFSNSKSQRNYTLGIGYRIRQFYADLAYQTSIYQEDFYPFYNEFEEAPQRWALVTPEKTVVTNTHKQLLLTVGVHF